MTRWYTTKIMWMFDINPSKWFDQLKSRLLWNWCRHRSYSLNQKRTCRSYCRNGILFLNFIQPLKNHSLSTECTFKPNKNWTYGFHTTCEAFVYYFPYNETIPTKCVSKPDEDRFKYVINSIMPQCNITERVFIWIQFKPDLHFQPLSLKILSRL